MSKAVGITCPMAFMLMYENVRTQARGLIIAGTDLDCFTESWGAPFQSEFIFPGD